MLEAKIKCIADGKEKLEDKELDKFLTVFANTVAVGRVEHQTGLKMWNERKQRINWDNLFINMYTDKPAEAEKFLQLPYDKKVCFTSFESDNDSIFCLLPVQGELTWERVNALAFGRRHDYDVFEMLLNGRRVRIRR